jgi:hypothetical protein
MAVTLTLRTVFRMRICAGLGVICLATAAAAWAAAQPAAPAAQVPAPGVESVLAANHAAVGDVSTSGTLELHYRYSGSGMTGTQTSVNDLATGAFIDSFVLGPTDGASGFDGKTPWMRDLSGANTTQEGGDRVPLAVNEAYRDANLWWRADHASATLAYVGRETLDGEALDHLVVTPAGGERFDAWFDAQTHLLSRIAEEREFFKTRTLYAGYAREGSALLAHNLILDGGTGEANYERLELDRAVFGTARPAAAYSRPTDAPVGAGIVGGASSVSLPFRFLNNHIYIEARVNGEGPYTFMVDTGGHTLLSPRIVTEAALRTEGKSVMAGAGEKISSSSYAKVREIEVGGVRMHDQTAFITEIYDPAIEGLRVDGMLGFELFRRFVARIDYGKGILTLINPRQFDRKQSGVAVPFKFYDHLPQIQGRIGDLPARFDIDTGSRSEIDITSPSVARMQLHEKYPHGVHAVTGWGVGGPGRSYVVRLPSLTLGDIEVVDPVAALSEAKAGSFSDPNYEGNIGSALLKRFIVTFDYEHQVMYLKRIVPQPVDAGRFDRSGMWINAADHGFSVMFVSDNGPAATAGIVTGDVITAIGGRPVHASDLPDARMKLRSLPAGTHLPIEIMRGERRSTTEIVLADQI